MQDIVARRTINIVRAGRDLDVRLDLARIPDRAIGKGESLDFHVVLVGPNIDAVAAAADIDVQLLVLGKGNVDRGDAGSECDGVDATPIGDAVLPIAGLEHIGIVAETAVQGVVAHTTNEDVVAVKRPKRVISGETVQAHVEVAPRTQSIVSRRSLENQVSGNLVGIPRRTIREFEPADIHERRGGIGIVPLQLD